MENIIRVNKKDNPFAQIDKVAIQDKRLSWKARGILCYLLSKPNDWKVILQDLINQSEKDGDSSVRAGIKELRNLGYMRLDRIKDKSGKVDHWEYTVYEKPLSDFPQVEKPQVENRGNNNNKLTNNKLTNIKATPSVAGFKELNELLDLFKEVNPTHYRLFANVSQRAALNRLVSKWGPEKIKAAINTLPMLIGKKYAPVITTPYQLENKFGDLVAYIQKEKAKGDNKIVSIV